MPFRQQMVAAFALGMALGAFAGAAPAENGAPKVEISDDFDRGKDRRLWKYCQIAADADVTFADGVMSIPVGEESLGGDLCYDKRETADAGTLIKGLLLPFSGLSESALVRDDIADGDAPGPLAPFFAPRGVETERASGDDFHCGEDEWRRVRAAQQEGTCIQRQEIRLKDKPRFRDHVEYGIRMRMVPGRFDQVNNLRSILMQWKVTPIDNDAYCGPSGACPDGWGASPFLALRFNNARLYATVQDEFCRCRVTGFGDRPERLAAAPLDEPLDCKETRRPDQPEESIACTPRFKVEYGPASEMASPVGTFRSLTVAMRGGHTVGSVGPGVIELYQDGTLVTRVTGSFGWQTEPGKTASVKFKFGHYRAYLPEMPSVMEVDRVAVRQR